MSDDLHGCLQRPYGELLSPQESPRAVHLMPEGLFLPARILRTMLRAGGSLRLRYTGYALAPFLRHGQEFEVVFPDTVQVGDLVLVDAGGWADVRRLFSESSSDRFTTGLDAFPGRREVVGREKIVAVIHLPASLLRSVSRRVHRTPLWCRVADYRHRLRRIEEAANVVASTESVRQKYEGQTNSYSKRTQQTTSDYQVNLHGVQLQTGARILVAGCGTGAEAIALARAGYHVEGVDFVPSMIQAAQEHARSAGVDARFFAGDIMSLPDSIGPFDLIYFTTFVYSFLPGRAGRIGVLRNLGKLLRPGGSICLSAKVKPPSKALQPSLAWLYSAFHGGNTEWGDWYTWYLSPAGQVAKSYSHSFFHSWLVDREIRQAGFAKSRSSGYHFVASDYVA